MLSKIPVLIVAAYAAIPDDLLNEESVEFANFASFDFDFASAPITCELSIERSLAGPYDWNKIVGSGNRFSDDYFFPANE